MPQYEVALPNGKKYRVNSPEPLSQDQVWQAVQGQVGLASPESLQSTADLESAKSAPMSFGDTARSLGSGLVGGAKSISDVFGAGTSVSKGLGEAQDYLQQGITPERKAEIARRQELQDRAARSGSLFQEAKAYLGGVAEAPIQSVVQAAGSSAPSILAGIAAIPAGAPAALALGVGTIAKLTVGAMQGVGEYKGSVFEAVKAEYIKQGRSPVEAERLAEAAQQYSREKAFEIGGSAVLGALDAVTGVEPSVGKAMRKVSPTGQLTKEAIDAGIGALPERAIKAPTRLGQLAKGMATEAPLEGAQGAFGQYGENVALQQAGADVSPMQGVLGAGVRDAAVGALFGGVGSPLGMKSARQDFATDQFLRQAKAQQEQDKQAADALKAEQDARAKTEESLNVPKMLALPAPAKAAEEEKDPLQNPVGRVTEDELGKAIGNNTVVNYINKYRKENNLPKLKSYSIEDIKDAMTAQNPEGEEGALNAILAYKTNYQNETYTPEDIQNRAVAKNVATETKGFSDFLTRTTGKSDVNTMTQPELHSVATALDALKRTGKEEQLVLPEGSNATRFTQDQYNQGVTQALMNVKQGKPVTLDQAREAIKAQTDLKTDRDVDNLLKTAASNEDLIVEKGTGFQAVSPGGVVLGTYGSEAEAKRSHRRADILPVETQLVRAPEEVNAEKVAQLPEGYEIQQKKVSGETTPAAYVIREEDSQKNSSQTFADEADAKERLNILARKREANAAAEEASADRIRQDLEKKQAKIAQMEADGQADTAEHKNAVNAFQAANVTGSAKITEHLDKAEAFRKPLKIVPLGKKTARVEKHTVISKGKEAASFPDRAKAEQYILTNASEAELKAITDRGGSLGKRAEVEMQDRQRTEPGIKVKGTTEGLEKAGVRTPEVEAKLKELEKKLKPMLDKFGLGNVGLNVVRAIENDADGAWGGLNNLIRIAFNADKPIKTMRHEALHALFDLGFFTPQQWEALKRQAQKTWVDKYLKGVAFNETMSRFDAYKAMGLSDEAILEEAIADAFGDWEGGAKPPPGLMAALFKRLQQFFAALRAALTGAGFESADEIFGKIERGELKAGKQAETEGGEKFSLAPEGIPQNIWNLHEKAEEADAAARGDIARERGLSRGAMKRNQTMAFRRLNKAVLDFVGGDEQKSLDLMVKMNEETSRRGGNKYSLSGAGVPMSTRNLMEVQTPVAQQELGLNTELKRGRFNNVRDIATALNQYTLDQLGAMDRQDLTQEDSTKIAKAIADEVAFQLNTLSKTGTGLGWYSSNYPNAVKRLAKRFPELGTSRHARSVFSAIVAVTSNGERVAKNIDNAIKLYAKLREGKPMVAMGNRRGTALKNNLAQIQYLLAEHGQDFEKVLLKEITVKEMNAKLSELGEDTDNSYLANTVVPAAAVYFGPKLGAFYANLSGSEGYLTMDLWWTRSINRMRGLLMPKATEASINKFRDMMDRPSATREEVVSATIPFRDKYEEYGFNTELEHLAGSKEPRTNVKKPAWFKKAEEKAGDAFEQLLFDHNIEKMANTIYKNEFEMLEEAPFTATDRKFMYDAARKAQTLLQKEGIDLTLADIQAALWYYEKRLYQKLSGRKADDIGYEEAIIAQANQGNGRARPSVVFDQQPSGGTQPRGAGAEAVGVRGQPTITSAEQGVSGEQKYSIPTGKFTLRPSGKSNKSVSRVRGDTVGFVGPAGLGQAFKEHDVRTNREIGKRPNVEVKQGDGRGFTGFFSNISLGFKGKPNAKPYEPTLNVEPIADFVREYNNHRGNFDDHIATSIPGFREVQTIVGNAIAKTYKNADMLDIGASEGALIKAVTKMSNGGVRTVALDPNFAMAKHFNDGEEVEGSVYDTSAFGTKADEGQLAWNEDETLTDRDGQVTSNPFAGEEVRWFKPDRQFDVIHEAMVFQFISGNRASQIARAKELMKPDGVLIIEEKFVAGDQLSSEQFRANETQKDAYKEQYFTKAEIAAKAKAVGVAEKAAFQEIQEKKEQQVTGMNDLMVSPGAIEDVLGSNFDHVAQFWDSGNFKGYIASDSPEAVERLINNMLSTDSEFANVKTPRAVKYSLAPSDDGIVLGRLQPDAVEFPGVHYGNVQTDELQGSKYGTGLRGADRRRLQNTDDERIKNRVYFYINKPDGTMPIPESGVGNHVYTQKFKNILGPGKKMTEISKEAGADFNYFEAGIVDAGYDGYAVPEMGMMVILNHNVPVNYRGTRAELSESGTKLSLRAREVPKGSAAAFFKASQDIPRSEGIEAAEQVWSGGIADFGDKEAALLIARMPGYSEYAGEIEQLAWEHLAGGLYNKDKTVNKEAVERDGRFYVYRYGDLDLVDEINQGEYEGKFEPKATTLSLNFAKAFKNFAGFDEEDKANKGWMRIAVKPESIIMLGSKSSEMELVVNLETVDTGDAQVIDESFEPASSEAKFSLPTYFPTAEAAEKAAYKKAPPETAEFKRFFGASKVKEEGRAQPMFHASMEDFNIFRENRPIFISPDASFAEDFIKRRISESGSLSYLSEVKNKSAKIYPLWVCAETPFDYENKAHVKQVMEYLYPKLPIADTSIEKEVKNGNWSRIEDPKFQAALKFFGFDSFYTNEGGSKNLAVFKANQVKSITGNLGEFGENKDIRYSLKNSAFHSGDLGYGGDTALGRIDGSRSTGHFGTGVYLVSGIEKLGLDNRFSGRADRPIHQVDLSPYKLAEPLTNYHAELLHDGLRVVNGLVGNKKGSREEIQEYLNEATRKIKSGLSLKESDPQIKKIILDAVKTAKRNKTDEVIYTSKYLDSASTMVIKGLGFDGIDVRRLDKFDNTKYGTVVYRESLPAADATPQKYSLPVIPAAAAARRDETTQQREHKGFIERILDVFKPESLADLRASFINRYNQLGVYDKMLADKMGDRVLMADMSAEAAANMSDLSASVTYAAFGIGNRKGGIPVYRNGVTTVDTSTKGPLQILAPLAQFNDPTAYQDYQYWAGVKRGSRFMADGREKNFDPSDIALAEQVRKAYLAKGVDFNVIQKEMNTFNNGLVDYMKATGVLAPERAAEFKKHMDYIPFYRQLDGENTVGPKIFNSISGVKPPKKLKGSEAPLTDYLESIVQNTQAAINAGMKNMAAQRAINVAMQLGPVVGAQRLNTVSSTPDTVQVLENGKQVSYRVADQLFINAVKNLNMAEIPFLGMLSGPSNLLRNLVTKDPGFMLANLARDSLSAWVTSGSNMTPIIGTAANFAKALSGKDPALHALYNAGILGGYEFSSGVIKSGEVLERDLNKRYGSAGAAAPLKVFSGIWDALEKGTEASDAATRMAVYERVLAETGNETEALYRALEVMNFNRKGSSPVVRILTAAIPFLNARIQGLDVFYRTAMGKNVTANADAMQKAFFVRGATLMALSAAYFLAVSDDDEWKKQEQETKDNYWIAPGIGKFPTPFEVGFLFKTVPERIMAYTLKDDTGQDLMNSMKRGLLNTFAFNPIPQVAKPLVEYSANYNFFTGRPIVGQGMEGLEPQYQVGPNTTQSMEWLGKQLGMSPIKLEQVYGGYTGTMGMYALSLFDSILQTQSDSPNASKRFEQLPIIKRFAADPEARGNITQYYELKKSVDAAVQTQNLLLKSGKPEEFAEFMEKHAGLLATKDYVSNVEKTMKQMREARKMIQGAEMSGDEKRDTLIAIGQAENNLNTNIQTIKKMISEVR